MRQHLHRGFVRQKLLELVQLQRTVAIVVLAQQSVDIQVKQFYKVFERVPLDRRSVTPAQSAEGLCTCVSVCQFSGFDVCVCTTRIRMRVVLGRISLSLKRVALKLEVHVKHT